MDGWWYVVVAVVGGRMEPRLLWRIGGSSLGSLPEPPLFIFSPANVAAATGYLPR